MSSMATNVPSFHFLLMRNRLLMHGTCILVILSRLHTWYLIRSWRTRKLKNYGSKIYLFVRISILKEGPDLSTQKISILSPKVASTSGLKKLEYSCSSARLKKLFSKLIRMTMAWKPYLGDSFAGLSMHISAVKNTVAKEKQSLVVTFYFDYAFNEDLISTVRYFDRSCFSHYCIV